MRRVLFALALTVPPAGLGAGCMDTRSASLGVEAQRVPAVVSDAASAPDERDAGAPASDADTLPPARDPSEGDDNHRDDDADADAKDERPAPDAGPPAGLDAGRALPAAADASSSDASVAHPSDERDGAREDAKGPVNPLCITEPWHCQ